VSARVEASSRPNIVVARAIRNRIHLEEQQNIVPFVPAPVGALNNVVASAGCEQIPDTRLSPRLQPCSGVRQLPLTGGSSCTSLSFLCHDWRSPHYFREMVTTINKIKTRQDAGFSPVHDSGGARLRLPRGRASCSTSLPHLHLQASPVMHK
jgi:hypothetical protein